MHEELRRSLSFRWFVYFFGIFFLLLLLLSIIVPMIPLSEVSSRRLYPFSKGNFHSPQNWTYVHHTWKDYNLSKLLHTNRASWTRLGFHVTLSNDEDCRADIIRLCARTGNNIYLTVYDNLETPVQKADFWRYSKLYLDGGVYSDIEVIALAGMVALIGSMPKEISLLLFRETEDTLYFRLRDWWGPPCSTYVCRPQIRNYIMAATPGHFGMLRTLENIVKRYQSNEYKLYEGVKRTLILTGPGVFTESMQIYMHLSSTKIVSLSGADYIFDHPGMNTWKGAHDIETNCQSLWLFLIVVGISLVIFLGFSLYLLWKRFGKRRRLHDA